VLLCAAATAPAQTFTVLTSFQAPGGYHPDFETLVEGYGVFYGTTLAGAPDDGGIIFDLFPSGSSGVLVGFNGTDGGVPSTGLLLGDDARLYGTNGAGGANGYGTVFKANPQAIYPNNSVVVLHSFDGTDGAPLVSGLIEAADGTFYGTTYKGGLSGNCESGCGTVFSVTPAGLFTSLHSFAGNDGAGPYGGVTQGTDGNFYGTTLYGGANGHGTVFKIPSSGALTTLYDFCSQASCVDGSQPSGALIQAIDGNFYGTTSQGGTAGYGTVFKITPSGTLTTLISFAGANGMYPYAGLVQATDGNFYGTTNGDPYGNGTIFKVTPAGQLTVLYTSDAQFHGGLIQATDGNFYGTSYAGGLWDDGAVYSLSVGLGPFVKALPTSGKVGTTILILGTNLSGATSVTFNGVPAQFDQSVPWMIPAIVPAGATTGKIDVTLPSGTLTSNVEFRVTQ
jgi:uncharacterized repeat protein (TIGR03803 family)